MENKLNGIAVQHSLHQNMQINYF